MLELDQEESGSFAPCQQLWDEQRDVIPNLSTGKSEQRLEEAEPPHISSLHWIDNDEGSVFTTYALPVHLPLDDVVVFTLGFVSQEATILELDTSSWSATVDFGDALVFKLRAHPWLTGLLLEFEQLAGDQAVFQDAVAQIGAFITEIERLWMSAWAYPLEFSMQ